MIQHAAIGHIGGIVQFEHFAIGLMDFVHNRRGGRDQVKIEFARKPFLHDFQMQKPQKATAEAKAKRGAGFRFIMEGCVVQAQLAE